MSLANFHSEETFFGLPKEIIFCKKCVISNQRPNSTVEYKHTRDSKKITISIDDHGLCDACKFSDIKNSEIDWKMREEQLFDLSNRVRKVPQKYNCIVPGSGGKDSFFQSYILKNKYGFRPLTITWAPHEYTPWGWQNFQSWINSGFDNYLVTPNSQVHRLLTRLAVENLFHPFQPFMIGQKALAPKLAAMFDIPLIFYGENEAEYGNPIADTNTATRDPSYFSGNQDDLFLSGISLGEIVDRYGIAPFELQQYMPIDREVYESKKIEVHYLGYYLKWHPQSAYYFAVENGGFIPSPERTPGTYSKYNSIDDKIDDLHYWTTFVKFGIGRATYDASQEIRNNEITREEAVSLVRKFDGEWPERFEQDLWRYLTVDSRLGDKCLSNFDNPKMTKEYFLAISESFRSPHLWAKIDGEWKLKFQVS